MSVAADEEVIRYRIKVYPAGEVHIRYGDKARRAFIRPLREQNLKVTLLPIRLATAEEIQAARERGEL